MRRSFQSSWSLPVIVLCMFLAGGCGMFNKDDNKDKTGDTGASITGVPRSATVEADGTGQLSYQAKDDGTVYLYDVQDHRVVDTQSVRKGQRYTADLNKDVATLDGRPVYEKNLEKKHEHRIYFDRQ